MSGEQQASDALRGGEPQPSEEELRAAYEAELDSMHTTDMLMQAAVTLLNLGARRLAPAPPAGPGAPGADPAGGPMGAAGAPGTTAGGRDLQQARDAIDAVRALLEILQRTIPAQQLRPLRDALSQLQMAYAREVQSTDAGPAQAGRPPAPQEPAGAQPPAAGQPPAPGQSPAAGQPPTSGQPSAPGQSPPADGPDSKDARQPGPAEASGRLWVPGS